VLSPVKKCMIQSPEYDEALGDLEFQVTFSSADQAPVLDSVESTLSAEPVTALLMKNMTQVVVKRSLKI
jgi:hypothetical protein